MLDKCEVIVTRIQVHSVVLALIPEIRFGANTARSVNVRRGARRLGGGRWLSQQRLGRAPTGSRPPRAERDEGGEPMAPPTALNATGASSTAPTAVGLATVQAIDNSSDSSMQGSCGLIKWCNSMLHLADRLTRQTRLGVHAETLVLTNAAESVRSMCPTPARLRPLRVVPLDQAIASAIRGWSDMLNFSRYDWKRRLPVSCCQRLSLPRNVQSPLFHTTALTLCFAITARSQVHALFKLQLFRLTEYSIVFFTE